MAASCTVAGVGTGRAACGTAAGTGRAACGMAAGTGRDACGAAAGTGLAAGFGREVTLDVCPPGPPGLNNLPVVIGRTTALPFGVGRETELGDSPCPTWMVPDLYVSSRGTAESFITLTVASLLGFLLYSTVCPIRKFMPPGETVLN